MRFHVGLEVITEDVRSASEALKQQALAEERATQLAQERAADGARPEDTQKQGKRDSASRSSRLLTLRDGQKRLTKLFIASIASWR
jgi:hypothetical protein